MIDAHQHYWNPARGDYGWLTPENVNLFRTFMPADLNEILLKTGISKTILVQAAPTVEETEYLLGIADATESVAGVVGWIDFENKNNRYHLERFAAHPKFKGIRPMIQDIEDINWMLRPELDWAFSSLIELDLTFDALGLPRHLSNFFKLFKRYPEMRVVIDHCMKPEISLGKAEGMKNWSEGIRRLGSETNAYCKISGLITEDSTEWTTSNLRPYVDLVMESFGIDRVMWGSDWPVCTLRGTYEDWHKSSLELLNNFSETSQRMVLQHNAESFYKININ